MGLEFELKYAASPETQEAIFRAFPGAWQTIAMETTYYDTPAGDLAARRLTLRRRLENGVSVCTVKTPAGTGGRGEWEWESDSIEGAIPKLCKLGGPQELLALSQKGLLPICGVRFTRQALLVAMENGGSVELALDRGVLLGGGREAPLCEVEAELKSGSREAAEAFAGALARRFGLAVQPDSKFRRALALAKGE